MCFLWEQLKFFFVLSIGYCTRCYLRSLLQQHWTRKWDPSLQSAGCVLKGSRDWFRPLLRFHLKTVIDHHDDVIHSAPMKTLAPFVWAAGNLTSNTGTSQRPAVHFNIQMLDQVGPNYSPGKWVLNRAVLHLFESLQWRSDVKNEKAVWHLFRCHSLVQFI